MWKRDFTIEYKKNKIKHMTTIELDIKEYDEALSECQYGTNIDDYIIGKINLQLKTELTKRSIVDYKSLTNHINDLYDEYIQEITPDNKD
ncbi:hypothetical protein FDB30_03855 [Clostridium botulinum]|uniref:hypothetical protein n=1 Tax=Clostridium botulinum TaxID=1491 RepID=UPI0007733D7B|nr:hypothetical protein [Clostridium botulinum]MBY7025226.1 hypothetical protein [Clostridium botulinum]NFE85461.1 hypothetical protein [Clostridium botulinum]NFG36819.1 hypothetical protein [Clostridium botulinum]NFN27383.1 hypothetical protein [Clostridium botulinum]NFN46616.1 hypothetical protein [Clostridium botulinum]